MKAPRCPDVDSDAIALEALMQLLLLLLKGEI
jgi:hypothetical protein